MTRLLLLAAIAVPSLAHAGDPTMLVSERARTVLPEHLVATRVVLSPTIATADATSVTLRWRRAPRIGRSTVSVTVRTADGGNVRGWAQLYISGIEDRLVATRALPAGTVIAADDVAMRPVVIEQEAAADTLRPVAVVGCEVVAAIPAGALVSPASVALAPPVERGTQVVVVMALGGASIGATGVLERAARPGERSSVRLTSTRRVVHGRLTSTDSFQVEVLP